MELSTNERTKNLLGMRNNGKPCCILDSPCELDYWCPVCKIGWDEGLTWSEYNGFVWCRRCNLDIPSPLAKKDLREGIKTFLDIIEEIKNGQRSD